MKKKVSNAIVIIIILALSVGGGYLYDELACRHELKTHPRMYNEEVVDLSYEFGVPASSIWAAVKVRSDFNAGLRSDDGRVGLMQLTEEQYYDIGGALGIATDPGLLYEPLTSLRIGTCWISSLFEKYARWDCVWAAMKVGEDTVDGWLRDPACLDGDGKLTEIPDRDAAAYAALMSKTAAKYVELYETAR